MTSWEHIYDVSDFFDFPCRGVADHKGTPHIFEAEFDPATDEYTGVFWLKEINSALLSSVKERREIWLRWQSAFERGLVDFSTHPALPPERERYDELNHSIGDQLRARNGYSFIKQARFRRSDHGHHEVMWLEAVDDA